MTLNELIEERTAIKSEMDGLNKLLKIQKERYDVNESALFIELDAAGIKRIANETASISINEAEVPDVQDWDELYSHILASGDFSLLQRRASSTAYSELLKAGISIPGVQPRTVRRINFKSL